MTAWQWEARERMCADTTSVSTALQIDRSELRTCLRGTNAGSWLMLLETRVLSAGVGFCAFLPILFIFHLSPRAARILPLIIISR